MAAAKPVLWQIKVSHFSEKVRWALDHKGVAHERKSPPPGAHMLIALAKSRGDSKTFPLLDLDGHIYSDSTDIIAALEERYPAPALYPADPENRRRALELEDFFDERVAPYTRLLAWHEILRHPPTARRIVEAELPGPPAAARYLTPAAGTFLQLRYRVKSDHEAEAARSKIVAGFDRLEAELDGRDYLVGNEFSVADLSAAALLYPVVLPAEGPTVPDPPPAYEEFRVTLADRPGFEWVEEIFRRHRRSSAARQAAAA